MNTMKSVICGIASIFVYSNNTEAKLFEKFPSSYEKDIKKSILKSWENVGSTMKGSIDEYAKEIEKSSN